MPVKPHLKPRYHELVLLELFEDLAPAALAESSIPLRTFRALTPLSYDTLGRTLKRLVDARALRLREIPLESKTGGRTQFEKRWSVGPAYIDKLRELREHPGLQGDRKFSKEIVEKS